MYVTLIMIRFSGGVSWSQSDINYQKVTHYSIPCLFLLLFVFVVVVVFCCCFYVRVVVFRIGISHKR